MWMRKGVVEKRNKNNQKIKKKENRMWREGLGKVLLGKEIKNLEKLEQKNTM